MYGWIGIISLFCSSILQGSIRYESTGIFPAQTFFEVNSVTGAINIIRSVRDDVILRSSYTVSQKHMCRSNSISNWWIGNEYLFNLWLNLLCITAASHCIWHSLPHKQSHLWCNYLSGSRWVWTCLHTICHVRDHHSGNHQHWQSGDHCIGCGPRC